MSRKARISTELARISTELECEQITNFLKIMPLGIDFCGRGDIIELALDKIEC